MANTVDLWIVYRFIKKLVTPFDETKAFELGVIDDRGEKIKTPKTREEKNAYNAFNRLVFNIKKLLEKIPGGRSKLASYAAALFLIREENQPTVHPDNIDEIQIALLEYMNEEKELVEEIANVVGTGNIAGAAPGEDPPVYLKKRKKKKKKKFGEYIGELRIATPKKSEILGIPRGKMPQVASKDYPELFDYLKENGVKFRSTTVEATKLKAIQSEFSKEGVIKSIEKTLEIGKDKFKPLIASKDNFIIDGHHRWLSVINTEPDKKIPIIQATNKNGIELLKIVMGFPKVQYKKIY